jgi:predicted dehydrogenase
MDLFHTAKENGVVVTAFHQTLYSPAFLKIKEIIASGKLGEVFQINLKYSGFARRWDWQTLQSKCAGSVYNSGPHPIGQALDLLGWDDHTRVAFSSLGKALTSGDADDIGMLILTAPGKPVVNIEINCADAYANDYVFKVFGKKGTLIATNVDYQMKYIEDFSAYPERPVIREPLTNAEGNPDYCKEELHFTEVKEKLTGTPFDVAAKQFYEMLYRSIKQGAPLEITPEMAAKAISVIETCHAQNPMPVMFD